MSVLSAPISPQSSTRLRRDEGVLRRLLRRPMAWCGFVIIALLLFVALRAPHLSALDPTKIFPSGVNTLGEPHAPTRGLSQNLFALGADTLGRDVLTRVLYGTRISLVVGFFAMISSVFLGSVVGLISGYFGGFIDGALMRFTDIVMSLPTVLLVIAFVSVLPVEPILGKFLGIEYSIDRNIFNMLLAIALVTWTRIARAVRGEVLSLKRREFIEAAHATGCSHARIIFRHLLPNVMPTILVLATLATANNILLEAGLSYLGLGTEAQTPSWGGMIAEGQPFLLSAPWISLAPGFAIVLAVAGFNLFGQALQETLETRA